MPEPNWRNAILKDFVPEISKLLLVADPDALLTEEKLALELRNRGFNLIEFNDPVEFRYAYESKYRARLDRGKNRSGAVVLRLEAPEPDSLPYDLLKAGKKLAFSLGELFPNLSYPVVEKLDRSLLDALFKAQQNFTPKRLGDNATRDFILRHVFGIDAEIITDEVGLLRTLLRLHYNKTQIPKLLCARLIDVLKARDSFRNWPLEEIIPEEEAFFAFLQERWPVYLDRQFSETETESEPESEPESKTESEFYETSSGKELKYPGPDFLPFGHEDTRVYIDNLFVEGKLTPVLKPGINIEAHSWIRSGIAETGVEYDDLRITRLLELVEKEIPGLEARYSDWLVFAGKWAELGALIHTGCQDRERKRFRQLGPGLNRTFTGWLSEHYAGLISLPPSNLAMLHHVSRKLARELEKDMADARIALVVVDGLSLDQWVTVRQSLQEQDQSLLIRESATFAWIPTLTSVSRQSIFAGKPPLYYHSSINTTNREGALWKQFWNEAGLSNSDIAYLRGLGNGNPAEILEASLNPGQTKVVGLVVDMVDKIMHGMQQGAAGMHTQLKQWAQSGFLNSLLGYLLDHGYQVWLTSDHGNIECYGKGRPSEGSIAEIRGERVRTYPTPELRTSVASSFTFAREWEPAGLPSDYFPLVIGGSEAFIREGEMVVGHGGISIEEVIVPLVKIERRTR